MSESEAQVESLAIPEWEQLGIPIDDNNEPEDASVGHTASAEEVEDGS